MIYDMARHGGDMVVRLRESLLFEDHDAFRDVLQTLSKEKCKRCVFDLSELSSVDSAGLGMLMIAYQDSRKNAWDMVLREPKGQVKRVLEITDLGKVIAIQ